MNNPEKKIIVCVTCYNNEEEVIDFAKMMNLHSGEDIPLVVSINSTKNESEFTNKIRKTKKNIFIVNPGKNLGYLNGCLFGAIKYLQSEVVDYIMITNTDVTFVENDFFRKLRSIVFDDNIWCIAPNVVRASNGAIQNPFMIARPTKKKMFFYKQIYSNQVFYITFLESVKLKRRILKREKKESLSGPIYASDGSCFILSKACAERVSEISSNIMMYGEEILVAEVVKINKKMEWYEESLHVEHYANASTSLMNIKRIQKWYKESFNWLYESFFR